MGTDGKGRSGESPEDRPTTGIEEVDQLIGGLRLGDNVIWKVDSGAPVDRFLASFLSAAEHDSMPVIYVSFNRSPQTIINSYARPMSPELFTLVDCFSSGKGKSDDMFLDFFKPGGVRTQCRAIRVESPVDIENLQEQLRNIASGNEPGARYIFDSLTGMLDLWGDEDAVLAFFGHLCPRLYDLNTIAYWLLEQEAHSERFLAKLRHITQVVLEVAVSQGIPTLTIRKAVNRRCPNVGVPQRFEIEGDRLVISAESREDRELGLLTRLGETVATALDPNSFFEQTMEVLAKELGMIRGTLVLLDLASNKLKIAAAHGLTETERSKGEYRVGEGITGRVVETGLPEVVPDISKDPRFLNRTTTRRTDRDRPIAFICVPLKLDNEVVGALSADRTQATRASLDRDLRLLTIVAATVSQVLKINRTIRVEKEEILARDKDLLRELRNRYRIESVVGQSEKIRHVLATAGRAAESKASILITGETGTGKELIANVIHYNSGRAGGPLVKVNCAALSDTLLESELFGHVRGAFTGAIKDRKGHFKLADSGTLFLDEVGAMSARLQVKLLRVLQEKKFHPVGGSNMVQVDVRVVAATNRDLAQEVQEGRFREDIYYRLNVIPIHLPPLRERREDIPLLMNHFLEVFNKENDRTVTKISQEVLDLFLKYPWPGNVRELENCIERAVVLSPGDALSASVLPKDLVVPRQTESAESQEEASRDDAEIRLAAERFLELTHDLAQAREILIQSVEETVLRTALAQRMSQRELAEKLGMSRTTLRKKLRRYRIES